MGKVFLFGPLILTNNWGLRNNILNISLDRNFLYIHDIIIRIRTVPPSTLSSVMPRFFYDVIFSYTLCY